MGVENPHIKKVFSNLPPHTPLAEISSLAPSCELEVAPVRCSFFTGCSSGSIQTSLHTSVSKLAVRSRISLSLIVGKPPFAQEKCMLNSKIVVTFTFCGQFRWSPAIPQGHGIMEVRSMQGEAMISEGKSSEPCGGTPLPGKVHGPL